MSVLSPIYAAIRRTRDLTPHEIVDLKRAANEVGRLSKIVKLSTRLAQPPRKRITKPPRRTTAAGTMCHCKRVLPHSTKDEWRRHMLSVKRMWMQQAASVYWHRVGYDKMGLRSGQVRNAKAMAWRTAIFKEMAPKTAAKMTDTDIHRIVMTVYPRQKPANNRLKFPGWVRKRYS